LDVHSNNNGGNNGDNKGSVKSSCKDSIFSNSFGAYAKANQHKSHLANKSLSNGLGFDHDHGATVTALPAINSSQDSKEARTVDGRTGAFFSVEYNNKIINSKINNKLSLTTEQEFITSIKKSNKKSKELPDRAQKPFVVEVTQKAINEGNLLLHKAFFKGGLDPYLTRQIGPSMNAEFLYKNGAGAIMEMGWRDVNTFINNQSILESSVDNGIKLFKTIGVEAGGDYNSLSYIANLKNTDGAQSESKNLVATISEISLNAQAAAKSFDGILHSIALLIAMPHSCMFGHSPEHYVSFTQSLLSPIFQYPDLQSANNTRLSASDQALLNALKPLTTPLRSTFAILSHKINKLQQTITFRVNDLQDELHQQNLTTQQKEGLETSLRVFKDQIAELERVQNQMSIMFVCAQEYFVAEKEKALQTKVNNLIQSCANIYEKLAPACQGLSGSKDNSKRLELALQLKSTFDLCKQDFIFTNYCEIQGFAVYHFRNKSIVSRSVVEQNNVLNQYNTQNNSGKSPLLTLRQSLGESTEHNRTFGEHIIKIFNISQSKAAFENAKTIVKNNSHRKRSNTISTTPTRDVSKGVLLLESSSVARQQKANSAS
jgi:hypothetical protein